tara:strand:+ start:174 stop:2381 length:2208 start_codon:yes stop_codon:yes gene_type:complete
MSLIVASSSQEQYGGVEGTRTQTIRGIEAPSSFQNYFTSPIKIPVNAEIAVESVKIRRDALVDIESQTMMYKYFGKLQTTGIAGTGYHQSRLDMPIAIRPNPGVYNTEDWFSEVADKLNISYGHPEIFSKYDCVSDTDATGKIIGSKIECEQRGDGSGTDIVGGKGAVTGDTMLGDYFKTPWNITNSDWVAGTNWTVANQNANKADDGKKITRAIANTAGGMDKACCMIGNGCPIALVGGVFNTFVEDAEEGWRVGLSRPQMEYLRDSTKTSVTHRRQNLLPGTADFSVTGEYVTSAEYRKTNDGRNQLDYYDYMVENNGTDIRIYQLSVRDYDVQVGGVVDLTKQSLVQSEVKYYGNTESATTVPYTVSTFGASFDGVEFRTNGDELSLWFTNAGTPANDTQIVGNYDGSPGSNESARGTKRWQSFLPLTECKNALYPKLMIKELTDSLTITEYTSHWSHNSARVAVAPAISQAEPVFRYPTYDAATTTFTTGDDFYTNNRVPRHQAGAGGDPNTATIRDTKNRPFCLSQTLACDTRERLIVDQTFGSGDINYYDGVLEDDEGVAKDHAFIIGMINPSSKNYYLEGKYATGDFAGQAKMNRSIGYPNRSFISQPQGVAQGYATTALDGRQVIFTSPSAPDYRVHSAFVRISNMPIQSYNGAKTSVSKMLYHLPRFTNDGREYGDLFFAPGEKTYVKLHNATPEILNNIQVQIVDVNERPVTDISGNTIVVFHLK